MHPIAQVRDSEGSRVGCAHGRMCLLHVTDIVFCALRFVTGLCSAVYALRCVTGFSCYCMVIFLLVQCVCMECDMLG